MRNDPHLRGIKNSLQSEECPKYGVFTHFSGLELGKAVAILPVENLTANTGAQKTILDYIEKAMDKKGYAVVSQQIIISAMQEKGLTNLHALSNEEMRAIGRKLKA